MEYCILVVNPGSTSTKIAVFQGEKALLQKTIRHSGEELAPFGAIMDQAPFRLRCVEQALAGFDLTRLDAVCARGGMLPACPSGAFAVDQDMIGYLSAITQGAHASNLGCVMARDLAEPLHIPAYVYDPVAVDEMPPMARITGIPELPRRMMGHALNTRAMAIRCAETVLHKPFDRCPIKPPWLRSYRKQLHGADTVPADCFQQIKCTVRPRAITRLQALTYPLAIGQQVIKIVCNHCTTNFC